MALDSGVGDQGQQFGDERRKFNRWRAVLSLFEQPELDQCFVHKGTNRPRENETLPGRTYNIQVVVDLVHPGHVARDGFGQLADFLGSHLAPQRNGAVLSVHVDLA
jgi:hypothetical protein